MQRRAAQSKPFHGQSVPSSLSIPPGQGRAQPEFGSSFATSNRQVSSLAKDDSSSEDELLLVPTPPTRSRGEPNRPSRPSQDEQTHSVKDWRGNVHTVQVKPRVKLPSFKKNKGDRQDSEPSPSLISDSSGRSSRQTSVTSTGLVPIDGPERALDSPGALNENRHEEPPLLAARRRNQRGQSSEPKPKPDPPAPARRTPLERAAKQRSPPRLGMVKTYQSSRPGSTNTASTSKAASPGKKVAPKPARRIVSDDDEANCDSLAPPAITEPQPPRSPESKRKTGALGPSGSLVDALDHIEASALEESAKAGLHSKHMTKHNTAPDPITSLFTKPNSDPEKKAIHLRAAPFPIPMSETEKPVASPDDRKPPSKSADTKMRSSKAKPNGTSRTAASFPMIIEEKPPVESAASRRTRAEGSKEGPNPFPMEVEHDEEPHRRAGRTAAHKPQSKLHDLKAGDTVDASKLSSFPLSKPPTTSGVPRSDPQAGSSRDMAARTDKVGSITRSHGSESAASVVPLQDCHSTTTSHNAVTRRTPSPNEKLRSPRAKRGRALKRTKAVDLTGFPMQTQDLQSLRASERRPINPGRRETSNASDPDSALDYQPVAAPQPERDTVQNDVDMDVSRTQDETFSMDTTADPSTLCPFCDELLPLEPTPHMRALLAAAKARSAPDRRPTNPLGLRAPLSLYVAACQRHRFESRWLPRAQAHGWPTSIDFAHIVKRVQNMRNCLHAIIEDRGTNGWLDLWADGAEQAAALGKEAPTDDHHEHLYEGPRDKCKYWREVLKVVKLSGRRAVAGVHGQFTNFEDAQTGYFGELGSMVMHQTLYDLFPPESIDPEGVAPLTPPDFIQRVLVPETAVRLVMEDLQQSYDDAAETLKQSAQYGVAMFPDKSGASQKRLGAAEKIVLDRAQTRRQVLDSHGETQQHNTDSLRSGVRKRQQAAGSGESRGARKVKSRRKGSLETAVDPKQTRQARPAGNVSSGSSSQMEISVSDGETSSDSYGARSADTDAALQSDFSRKAELLRLPARAQSQACKSRHRILVSDASTGDDDDSFNISLVQPAKASCVGGSSPMGSNPAGTLRPDRGRRRAHSIQGSPSQ